MRHLVTAALAALAIAGTANGAAAQGPGFKWAFIDSRKIIDEAPGAQQARDAFEKEMASYQAELDVLAKDLKQSLDEYDQQQVTMSPDAKQKKQEQIQAKQDAYQRRQNELQQKAQEKQAELVEPIMKQINTVLQDIREKDGYDVIFDVASGAVAAADPSKDLTDQVLTRLKAMASK